MLTNNLKIYDFDSEYTESLSEDVLLKDSQAITNFILNLLSSSSADSVNFQGDRLYEPTYGSNLEYRLFEPMDSTTADDIVDIIYNALTSFLPELLVPRSGIAVGVDEDSNSYKVIILYKYNNVPQSIKFTLSGGDSINANN